MTADPYALVIRSWRTRKWLIPLSMLACFIVTLILLRVMTPLYTAEMTVGPTARHGVAGRGIRLPQQLTNNETIRPLPAELSDKETLSDYARFLELLHTPEIAQALLQNRDLNLPSHISAQPSLLKHLLRALAGQDTSATLDAVSLAAYLKKKIVIEAVGYSAMRNVRFRHHDAEFARRLLNALYAAADQHLRLSAKTRTGAEISYLENILPQITAVDQRNALATMLDAQRQTQMMIQVDLPFAADQVTAAHVPNAPDYPPAEIALILSFIVGALIGGAVHYFEALRQWQTSPSAF